MIKSHNDYLHRTVKLLSKEDLNMDISFRTQEGRFNYRVAGVILCNNRILIMKDEYSPYYYIPGGRVQMNELSEDAIVREVKEELNTKVKVNRLLWVNESFFQEECSQENFHEICFYYLLDLMNDELIKKGDEFVLQDNEDHNLTFFWKDIKEIENLYLYPLFIKQKVLKLPEIIEHVVENRI